MTAGERARAGRLAAGLSQSRLAKRLALAQDSVSEVERDGRLDRFGAAVTLLGAIERALAPHVAPHELLARAIIQTLPERARTEAAVGRLRVLLEELTTCA